jgi:hypothetical protein
MSNRLRDLLGVMVLLCSITVGVTARAAGEGDADAEKSIKQAISGDYLATRFDSAEATLIEVSKCGEPCSPAVMAKAWMYVGLVRIVGKNDVAGARVAFAEALKADPQAQLDADLETPEARSLWQEVQANPAAATEPPKPTVLGGMQCTPVVREVQTRRPVPVACSSDQPATRAELKYREFGSTQWHTVQMGSAGGKWLGTIPCSATDLQGKLSWYVNAIDPSGELIDNYGAQRQPVEMQVVESTSEPAPAYPDQDPPTRCGAASECPPEMLGTPACPGTIKPDPTRGNKEAGERCQNSSQCSTGLDCVSGECQPPRAARQTSTANTGAASICCALWMRKILTSPGWTIGWGCTSRRIWPWSPVTTSVRIRTSLVFTKTAHWSVRMERRLAGPIPAPATCNRGSLLVRRASWSRTSGC